MYVFVRGLFTDFADDHPKPSSFSKGMSRKRNDGLIIVNESH